MPKNPVEGADAAGPADHSQVQSDRHHLRGMRPLAMQPVEGVDRISGEIGGAAEPVGMEELHDVTGYLDSAARGMGLTAQPDRRPRTAAVDVVDADASSTRLDFSRYEPDGPIRYV